MLTATGVPRLSKTAPSPRAEWWLTLLWIVPTSYNLFKPFRVDDTAHLEIAEWIAGHPLHPMSGFLNWNGSNDPIHFLNQPHLYFYLMALWGAAFGYSEIAMHALESIFAFGAIVFFYRLAKHVAPSNSLWLTAMLAFSPSFFVEQNTMLDVPLLSIWLVFFGAVIVDADTEDAHQGRRFLTAAVACSAALLVKYSSLLLFPIVTFTIVYERRWRFVWTLLIPPVVLLAWSLFNYFDYGGVHILEGERLERAFPQGLDVARRVVAWLLALGAITPLGLIVAVHCLAPLRRAALIIYTLTISGFALILALVAGGRLNENAADALLTILFFLNSFSMLAACAYSIRRSIAERSNAPATASRDSWTLILVLWIGAHLAFYSLFSPFMAVRHVLLVLPAVLLLVAQLFPDRMPRLDAIFGVGVSLFLSVALGAADWRVAAFFRTEATRIGQSLPTGSVVWFTGHWEWKWYATEAGFREVDVNQPHMVSGDFLVIPEDEWAQTIVNAPPMTLLRSESKPLSFLDIFCTARPARFYGTGGIRGPWMLTKSCTSKLDIYRID